MAIDIIATLPLEAVMRRIAIVVAVVLALISMGGAKTTRRSADEQSTEVRLTLSEGTSMSAALSPDGRTIVIDLLGALWTLSVDGGRATRILEDGYDAHAPVWSPDSQRLAFQAYRDGNWHIWTMNRDGSGLRQETSGPFDDREPHWSPDGRRIAFSSDRPPQRASARVGAPVASGNYDVWTLTVGTRAVQQITSGDANEFAPAWSPDGREIAYVSDRRERGVYATAMSSRAERLVHADARTLAAPSWSSDGQRITYVAFDGARSYLVSGGNNIAEPTEDVFPFRAQSIADGNLLYTSDGKIKTRPASGGAARTIEFAADVSFTRAAFTPKGRTLAPKGPQPVRGIMHPDIAPDGSRIVFAALGDLWLAPATAGEVTPERLTHDAFVDTDPAWSPDGAQLAFSSDRDGSMDLWIRDMKSGTDRKLAPRAVSAAWSPDGARIAFLDPESQLQIVDVASGQVRKAHDRLNEPGRPSWLPGGRAVVMGTLRPYSTRFREGTNQVLLVPIDLSPQTTSMGATKDTWFNPIPHKSIGMREDFGPAWSPDGTQLAAIIDGHLAVLPVGRNGVPLGRAKRLSPELASTPSWTRDSKQLLYQSANGFGLVNVSDGSVRGITPRLSWNAKETSGALLVHAGRLFDGRGSESNENVDVVIEGNRIARIEPHRADLHVGTVVDASRGTVLPGLIESHAHLTKGYGEALGRIWLSFGITSVRNPAANPFEALEDRESIDAGFRVGPRVFATGEPFDGSRIYYAGGTSLDGGPQLAEHLARAQALDFDFIKTYVRLPDLLQKQVIDEAHGMGMPVTSHEIYPAVAYGADGVEHIRGTSRRGYSPKMSELRRSYRDVLDLLTASKMTLTPTIVIQGGFQLLTLHDGSWIDDPRLQRLFPSSALDAGRALRKRGTDAHDLAEREALVSAQEKFVAAVVNGGGRVIAGTDSPINPYGLALLAELEHYVRGGLSPAEAIRTATAVPAEAMGVGADLGTIEVGKLADLVVVDGNPLANITDIRKTRLTIKDGVVYEVDTLLRGTIDRSRTAP
jgi:Tol biopolymer transport system component/imidazolonepropionase-like amidohydrolase